MTSTSINVGLQDDGTRLSSRVLRPPGGGHTDIFGGDPEPPRGRRLVPSAANAGCQISEGTNQQREATQANGHAAEPAAPAASEPDAAAPEPVASAPEPVPSAPKAAPQAAPEPAKARVRVPPGGFSSGLW